MKPLENCRPVVPDSRSTLTWSLAVGKACPVCVTEMPKVSKVRPPAVKVGLDVTGAAWAAERLRQVKPARSAVPNHLDAFIGILHTTACGVIPREIYCNTRARGKIPQKQQ